MTLNFKIFLAGCFLICMFVAYCAAAAQPTLWNCEDTFVVSRQEASIKVCKAGSSMCMEYTEPSGPGYCATHTEEADGVEYKIERCVDITSDGAFKGILFIDDKLAGTQETTCSQLATRS